MAPSPHPWQRQVPKTKLILWYGITKCNTPDCRGGEFYIAKQNLVLAVDASGSLREDGYKIFKNFAAGLFNKYMGKYYRY